MPRARSQRASQKPSRPASKATAMRVIERPFWVASARQRINKRSNSTSLGSSFLSGWRSMPGTMPATSQLAWLISMTATMVLSCCRGVRDRLKSSSCCGMGRSIGVASNDDGAISPPSAHSISVKALALALGPEAWTEIAWREGVAGRLTSRFARVRVRAAHRDYWRSELRPEEWLVIEWPEGEKEPTKYWFSTLPEDIGFARLVELAKLRGRIERDYQELKQELGLGHYEGRGWRGFHHHASLCLAAYGFLIAERVRIPPSGSAGPKLKAIGLPECYRPRGASDPTGAARPDLNRHHAPEAHRGPGPKPRAMSVLRNPLPQTSAPSPLVTQ